MTRCVQPPSDATGGFRWQALRVGNVLCFGALATGYLALYLILDYSSFIESLHGFDITPWNPPAGLTLTLLLIAGVRYLPVVALAALVSSQVLPPVAIPPSAAALGAAVIAVGYGGTVTVLRRFFGFDDRLPRARDVISLIAVATAGAGVVALGFATTYAAAGLVQWRDFPQAALQYWIGDAIGAVVLAPPLLLFRERVRSHRLRIKQANWLTILEAITQWAAIGATLVLVFGFTHDRYAFQLFYLLFVPMVWIATRHGIEGASLAVISTQAGLIAILELQDSSAETVRTFQMLMFAVAATGLILGAVVSERRRVAQALAESQGRLAAILNAARDGVLTIDSAGRVESMNSAAEDLLGRPSQSLIGTDIRDVVDRSDLLKILARGAPPSPEEPLRLELHVRRSDSAMLPVEVTAGGFGPPGDEHRTLVIRDISGRREAEARARHHQSQLAQVSRFSLAGEMASALAHELNQPLMAITSYARGCLRLLRQAPVEPTLVREGVEQVVLQAERAGDVIARVRDFIRTGDCRQSCISVKTLLDAAVGLTQIEAVQNGVDIDVATPPDLPDIWADRVQIEQVLLNLLLNAMDAVLGSGVARRLIVIAARCASEQTIEIAIRDTGPGLDEEVGRRLFEPFVTTKPLGMGLGLPISRSIVEAHGGTLRLLQSGPTGTVFAFELPICRRRSNDDG